MLAGPSKGFSFFLKQTQKKGAAELLYVSASAGEKSAATPQPRNHRPDSIMFRKSSLNAIFLKLLRMNSFGRALHVSHFFPSIGVGSRLG